MVLFLLRVLKTRMWAALFAIAMSPGPALAEIDLGSWQTHAAMAEQGAVCGAFADLMAMQMLVDEKVGRLWSERRAYSGSVIRRAAELEGRDELDDADIDDLLNRYSMWLLNNLANPGNAEILDPAARDAASDMIGEVCAGLYAQADRAILKKHPPLGACSPGQTPLPVLSGTREDKPATCEADDALLAATTIKQAEDTVRDMLVRLEETQARASSLSNEIAILQIDNDRLLREIDDNRIVATKVDDLSAANTLLRDRIASLEAEREGLKAATAELQALEQERRELAAKADGLQRDLTGQMDANRTLTAEIRDLGTRHDDIVAQVATLTAELESTRVIMRDLTSERDSLSAELDVAMATLEDMTGTTPSSTPNQDIGNQAGQNDLEPFTAEMTATPSPVNGTVPDATPEQRPPTLLPGDETSKRSFVVQLGAFSSRTGALSEINRLQTSFPGRRALSALTVTPTQRGDGSSIFRIVTDEMPAEDAQRLCGELWGGMVSCMLRPAEH